MEVIPGKKGKITSECGNKTIFVVLDKDGTFVLHKYVKKFDPEEGVAYEIRELPNPGGRYDTAETALSEASHLLK